MTFRPLRLLAAASGAMTLAAAPVLADTGDAQPAGSRGIFVATLVTAAAQTLGTSAIESVAGSIKGWFAPAQPKQTGQPPATGAKAASALRSVAFREGASDAHAGIAYEVHLLRDDGTRQVVDPRVFLFNTGNRFVVLYRATMPGQVEVFNAHQGGKVSRIDGGRLAGGQLATLGPYRFVGTPGSETLRIVVAPCSTPALVASSRAIVKVASAGERPSPTRGATLQTCDGATHATGNARSIRTSTTEGATSFALDRLSREEIASGHVAPRVIEIRLRHQR